MKKTANFQGAELARNHKSVWTAQECCLLVARGLDSNVMGRSRGRCGKSLQSLHKTIHVFQVSMSKGEIGAKTVKRVQMDSSISLYQRLKMNSNDG